MTPVPPLPAPTAPDPIPLPLSRFSRETAAPAMAHWHEQLRDDLARRAQAGLARSLEPVTLTDTPGPWIHRQHQRLINLAGNDYLALSRHPHLIDKVTQAVARYGTGSGASRLVTGTLDLHAALEARFAAFKHAQAALLLPTGYMANYAVLATLPGEGDLICLDKLAHASLIDAAHASRAHVRVVPHRHHDKLQRLLGRHQHQHPDRQRFIVTDSVFSMDGDCADLRIICECARRYDAVPIIDEAHGTGVLGAQGSGLCELQGVSDFVAEHGIVISTASKALGSLGGIITASRLIIDTLINRARFLIYTTAVPPAQVASIDAALDVIAAEPQRRQRLGQLTGHVRAELIAMGWLNAPESVDDLACPPTPIIPLIVGQPNAALELSQALREAGIHAPAIRPPTVAPGTSRVRISLRADLPDEAIDKLLTCLRNQRMA